MQRHTLRAVALSLILITSVFAGVPLTATASDDPENFDPTDDETYETDADESLFHGFASHDGLLWVAGGTSDTVYAFDENFETVESYELDFQPGGLARFDGEWVVSSGQEEALYTFDDDFENEQEVADDFTDTELPTVPWNIDAAGDELYVADGDGVAVLDTDYEEVDRFEVEGDELAGLHVAGDSVFVADDTDDTPVWEYSLEGELRETIDVEWGMDGDLEVPFGFGLHDGMWYVGTGGDEDEIYEYHAVVDDDATLSGTVTDQHDTGVSNATVTAWGVRGDALDVDPDEIETEADALLSELENPLPDAWDSDYDLDAHTEIDGTYALVHEADDWGVTTTHIGDSTIDDPRLTVSSERDVIVSLWDPSEQGGLVDNQVGQSFPGSVVSGTVVVEQLSPTGETTQTRELETEPLAETTGWNPLSSDEHHGVETQLPVGVYRVYPESNEAGGYVFTVGEPDEIAASIVEDLEDEAGELTDRADRVRGLLDDETVVRETTTTNADGEFSLEIDDDVTSVSVEAVGADDDALESITDPSLESLSEVREGGYNGSVYVPVPSGETYDPPEEDIEVDVVRSPEIPFDDMERFEDLLELLDDEFLDSALDELDGWDERFDEIDADRLEGLHDNLSELVEDNDALEDIVEDALDDDVGDGDVRDELEAIQEALDELEEPIDAEPPVVDPGDDDVSLEFPIDLPLDPSEIAVVMHTSDGETHPVGDEYWSVESSLFGSDAVVIDEYPLEDVDSEVVEFDVVVAGESVGSVSERVENPAVGGEVPEFDAVVLSSLSPGPSEDVTVGVDAPAESAVDGVSELEVFGPDGEPVNASVEDMEGAFATDGEGVYHLRMEVVERDGSTHTVSERVRAGSESRSEYATLRAGESVSSAYAVVGGELEGGSVDVDGSDVALEAVVPIDETPGEFHIQPDAVVSGSAQTFDVSVVDSGGEQVRSHVSTIVHSERVDSETLYTHHDGPITHDGETRYGEVDERDSGKFVIYTYTDERGELSLEVNRGAGLIDRFWHSASQYVPSVPFVGFVGLEVAIGDATRAT